MGSILSFVLDLERLFEPSQRGVLQVIEQSVLWRLYTAGLVTIYNIVCVCGQRCCLLAYQHRFQTTAVFNGTSLD